MDTTSTGTTGLAWQRDPLPEARRATAAEIAARCRKPVFGTVMTEHIVTVDWTAEDGWHDARLRPYGPLEMDPAMVGLQYGQVVFEGFKAFRHADGAVTVFRPTDHAHRFRNSARRLALPEMPVELFLDAVRELVVADERWVPAAPGQSLYLRPVLYATTPSLALAPGDRCRFLLLAFVTETFFGADTPGVPVWITRRYTRAVAGGTGEAKCAGNYAAGMLAQQEAAEHGCSQVVWLDAVERRWVEEMGGMNLFFVYGRNESAQLITPPLSGTILPGVTRATLLELASDRGLTVAERRLSVENWRVDAEDGAMTEVFACGTAAGVTPVTRVVCDDGEWTVGEGRIGPVTAALRDALVEAQRGGGADPRGWRMPVAAAGERP